AGPRGRRVLAGLPSRHPRQPPVLARGAREIAAAHRRRLAVRVQSRRAVGIAPWLRHGGADGQRHHEPPGGAVPRRRAGAAVLSGVGDRLPDRLSDGVRRDGRAPTPRERGRKLARAHFARSGRTLARRTWPGAGGVTRGRAEGIHVRRAGALVDGEPDTGRSAPSSGARAPPLRNAAALGATLGAARPPRAGVAGAGLSG